MDGLWSTILQKYSYWTLNWTLKHYLLLNTILFLGINTIGAQNFVKQIQKIKYDQLDGVETSNGKITDVEFYYLKKQIELIKNNVVDNTVFKYPTTNLTFRDTILYDILKGDFNLFKQTPDDSLAFDYYSKALTKALNKSDTILVTESSKKILFQLFKSRQSLEAYPNYLAIYKDYLYDNNELATYRFHKYNYQGSAHRLEQIDSLKIALKIANQTSNNFLKGKINQMIGVQYDFFRKERDSSLKYYNEAKTWLESKPYKKFQNELFGIYGNLGLIYQVDKDYNTAKYYFLKADSLDIPKYRYVEKVKINEVLSDNAKFRNNWEEALHYLALSNKYSDTLNEYNKAEKINEINVKYQTAEKEKQNLVLEKQKTKNQNIAIGLGGSLALGSIIAFLLFKNTKRKQKLAEQQKEIESQKLTTVLKEQELTAIDAMIEGQEKERQRIANDLHDDLGGLMATVKLHFNALKDKDSPELFDKTNSLIEEAYQKVRSVAHAKNSGVIAKQGLLKAVQNMADKISASNKIQIEVLDHGLDNRLENSLELTIFRVIQELITNVMKHADATEATVHLTNHEDSINIMVEDNGKGFNPSQITKTNKGMGISSIDKRIEHLDGKLTIESEKNKGTTVIIDIPL